MHGSQSAPDAHSLLVDVRPVEDGVVLVHLRGEADLHSAPLLRDALNEAIDHVPRLVVVDLSGVSFIDSMMLGVLLGASRRTRSQGTALRIVVDNPHVRRIFEITLLDQVMQLCSSVDAARAAPPDSPASREAS